MATLRADSTIDEVIDEYKGMVYGVALSRVLSRVDADDVFQEVFLAYYRKNMTFSSEEHRRAWLIRATLNCTKKQVSSSWKSRTEELSAELSEKTSDGRNFAFELEEQSLVFDAVRALPAKYRTVIHLFYFEDMTAEQIGKALHSRPGTVRMQLTRGRELLKENLKGDWFYE